jgi:hypothetical protein
MIDQSRRSSRFLRSKLFEIQHFDLHLCFLQTSTVNSLGHVDWLMQKQPNEVIMWQVPFGSRGSWWGAVAGPSLDICWAHHDLKLPFGSWPDRNEPELGHSNVSTRIQPWNKCTIQVVLLKTKSMMVQIRITCQRGMILVAILDRSIMGITTLPIAIVTRIFPCVQPRFHCVVQSCINPFQCCRMISSCYMHAVPWWLSKLRLLRRIVAGVFVLSRTLSAPDDSLHKISVRAKHMIHKKLLQVPTSMTSKWRCYCWFASWVGRPNGHSNVSTRIQPWNKCTIQVVLLKTKSMMVQTRITLASIVQCKIV